MKPQYKAVVTAILLFSAVAALGDDGKPPKISDENRALIIRIFNAEQVFARSFFPMGKVGLKIDETGKILPDAIELRQMVAQYGPAAKPGDRVKITNVLFKGKMIIFEINGGPVKKKKWYERLSVSGMGGEVAPMDKSGDPTSLDINSRGSYVALVFKDYIPTITAQDVKKLLRPVLDFNATNAAQAYAESLPPIVQQAIKNHRALVGMDRDMVVYAMGRAPRKIRDRDGTTDYEEWIYGEPPKEVTFVRFVGDRVVRIETMKVDGQKEVRTAKEVDLDKGMDAETLAKKQEASEPEEKKDAPTLLRPGERPVVGTPGAPNKSTVPGGTGPSVPPNQLPPPSAPGSNPTTNPDPGSGGMNTPQ